MDPTAAAYFDELEADVDAAYAVAERARERGKDPSESVEIPIAKDMADRVQNLLGIPGVADRVRELEAEMSREEAALALAADFAAGRVGNAADPQKIVEDAVRTSVALLTEGVVAAPIEGIDAVEIRQNDDGTGYVAVEYAGPIRSAGGTAQALSVLVADYTRSLLDIGAYRARDDEVERYVEEVALYDSETGLQYSPSSDETRHIARNCPILLDGEPTSEREVSGYRDLERVDTNRARGGLCLVLAEGIALKAPKIKRYTGQLDPVDWPWLDELIAGDVDEDEEPIEHVEENGRTVGGLPAPTPSDRYLRDLIAGRPVFSHPSRPGGFRLRYGRARNHGFATAGVHPATMRLLDDFLAPGTQVKTERPGKAAGVVPVDSIEGPTVKLRTGEVRRIDDPAEAKEIRGGVDRILDIGEYLVNPGEFVENNYNLAPAGYAVEWWTQELDAAGGDVAALRDDPSTDLVHPDAEQAVAWSIQYDVALHPEFTYLWHDVSASDVSTLARTVQEGRITAEGLVIEPNDVASTLEDLIVPHQQTGSAILVATWRPLVASLGLAVEDGQLTGSPALSETASADEGLAAVNILARFSVRAKAPTRIGNRMGRPEKSESRDLSPAVHTLFPIGNAGGDQRDVADATGHADTMNDRPGVIEVELGERRCPTCGDRTFRPRCPDCDERTELYWECNECGTVLDDPDLPAPACPRCERTVTPVSSRTIDVDELYHEALDRVGERETAFPILKGVKGLMSAQKTPEPMEKGVLRAKHGVSAFKDGTVRYDMTDLPVTAVRPDELSVPVEQFRELGYEEDIHGEALEHGDQLIELQVQDVVLSTGAGEHLLRTANFVDDLLTSFYDLEPYYEVEDPADLVGELVFGLAPHTSAAVVGRIVGFTDAAVGYAHPYFHAAKRRNCFDPATEITVEDNGSTRETVRIDEFVENRLADSRMDDYGTEIAELDDGPVVPSIDRSGNRQQNRVTAVAKHPAPNFVVQIETKGGRNLRVTPDHPLLRYDETGRLAEVAPSDLDVGDRLPVCRAAPSESSNVVLADGGDKPPLEDEVTHICYKKTQNSFTYSITVEETNIFVANGVYGPNCDGDEDCVMLLMDGLLNFSKFFLPSTRGGKMDAPLVMSSRIDPGEIDDEAHNIDVVDQLPLSFYEATLEGKHPDEVDLHLAEETVGTDDEYRGFAHTHDVSDIAIGPSLSAYKTLDSMMDKMDAQLELARKLRPVDSTDVAERVIESHFLPDLIGNLRAFSSQETRCLGCGTKYRRVPLTRNCRRCGGDMTLTVHEGSVKKYMDTALRIANQYGCQEYTIQRLQILERSLESLFEDDTNKQSGIADFM